MDKSIGLYGPPSSRSLPKSTMTNLSQVKAIVFDVFGTVVDWQGTIIREVSALGDKINVSRNWGDFADRWRQGYHDGKRSALNGERDWLKADTMHWERLELLQGEFGLDALSHEELKHLNKVWHRLTPWPDSVEGLERLKKKFIIGTLSNGDNGLLVHMAKNAGLPRDVVMGAESFKSYKPDPKVYLGAVDLLGYQAHEVMVAAAHLSDLNNARKYGLRTGFVVRPDEFGDSGVAADLIANEEIDVEASDFIDLAKKMGA